MSDIIRRGIAAIKRRESGQTLVEFVFVFPLFIVILFMIIEFGWMAYQKAAFDYSRLHASWDYGGLDVSSPTSLGYTYESSGSLIYTTNVDQAVKSSIEKAPSIGFNKDQLTVRPGAYISVENTPSEFTVPDRKQPGSTETYTDPTTAKKITRKARLRATVEYTLQPIAGFVIQPITVTEEIDVTHTVGDRTTTY